MSAIAPLGEVTRVNPENRSFKTVGKIVTLGEVVADAYEEQIPSELRSSSKPVRAATVRSHPCLFPLVERDLRRSGAPLSQRPSASASRST
jgi:hypothetical protein